MGRARKTKVCIACSKRRKLAQFYAHPRMADGLLNKCKACCRAYTAKRKAEKSKDPEWAAREAERHRQKELRRYHEKRRDDPTYRAARAGAARRWVQRNPERRKAQSALSNAVRNGKVKKPGRCSRCRKKYPSRRIHGHHSDYSRPLEVVWLCAACHGKHHRRS